VPWIFVFSTKQIRVLSITRTIILTTAYDFYLITTGAGGLGINLTGADTAIFLDSNFNPQMYPPLHFQRLLTTVTSKQWPAATASAKPNR
jgi:hypothetical protein